MCEHRALLADSCQAWIDPLASALKVDSTKVKSILRKRTLEERAQLTMTDITDLQDSERRLRRRDVC